MSVRPSGDIGAFFPGGRQLVTYKGLDLVGICFFMSVVGSMLSDRVGSFTHTCKLLKGY